MPLPLIAGLLVFLAIFLGSYAVKPPLLGRGIRTIQLLSIAAFCVFGFLASFELPGIGWRIAYAALGAIAMGGAILPWLLSRVRAVNASPNQNGL